MVARKRKVRKRLRRLEKSTRLSLISLWISKIETASTIPGGFAALQVFRSCREYKISAPARAFYISRDKMGSCFRARRTPNAHAIRVRGSCDEPRTQKPAAGEKPPQRSRPCVLDVERLTCDSVYLQLTSNYPQLVGTTHKTVNPRPQTPNPEGPR